MKNLIQILFLIPITLFAQDWHEEQRTYEYDNLNRLVKVVFYNGIVYEYQYDNLGNRLGKTIDVQLPQNNYELTTVGLTCINSMSGEMQKGTVYYRCQTKGCPTKSIREDTIEHYIKNMLKTISLRKKELDSLLEILSKQKEHKFAIEQKRLQSLEFQKNSLVSKEKKLLDAYLENLIEKEEFEQRKSDLLMKIHELDENINEVKSGNDGILSKIKDFLELSNEPLKLYNSAVLEEKREMLKNITSNLTAKGKGVVFSMFSPYYELANEMFY